MMAKALLSADYCGAESRRPPTMRALFSPPIASKLFLKPAAHFRIADRLASALDVAALSGRLVENMVGRLDQMRRFKLAQKIARADQVDAFIDNRAAAFEIRVLKKQKGARLRIGAQKPLQRLDRGLFAKAAYRAAFVEAALLVDGRYRWERSALYRDGR